MSSRGMDEVEYKTHRLTALRLFSFPFSLPATQVSHVEDSRSRMCSRSRHCDTWPVRF